MPFTSQYSIFNILRGIMKKTIYLLLSLFFITSCFSQEVKNEPEISGELNSGLREIIVDFNKPLNYKVYRGDYIVFILPESKTENLIIPGLEIETTLPIPENKKPYLKMKKSGLFKFSLGNKNGEIEVVDYTESNYNEVTSKEAIALIENINPFILDVRTQGEYLAGHIDGAGLIPVQVLSSNLEALEGFKNEPILLYCQSGNRSTVASKILIDAGFKNIYNLRFGIGEWKIKGYKTVK